MTIEITDYDIEWFINTVLLGDIKTMICTQNIHYLGFGVVACGIEFLGACMDANHFNQKGLSRRRFEEAITTLFDCGYHQYASQNSKYDLYKHLRCGMAHIMRPQGRVAFTHHQESIQEGTRHLQIQPEIDKLVLISENFYCDFADACRKLKQEMRDGKFTKKLTDIYLPITKIEP